MKVGRYTIYYRGLWGFVLFEDPAKCCGDCRSTLEWKCQFGPIGILKFRDWRKDLKKWQKRKRKK